MNGRAFLDTNILIYFYSESEATKRQIVYQILNSHCCITSIQALNEASNVWFKRYGWDGVRINKHLDNIELVCDEIIQIQRKTINMALSLKDSYGYSYYDCLILASALESDCDVVITEDMSAGQIIEHKLKIENPFKNP